MRKTLLWLDDIRNPFENHWVETFSPIPAEELNHVEWVKSYDEFVQYISTEGLPDAICFDHDIGLPKQLSFRKTGASKRMSRKLARETEKTGYDCAKWLVDYCLDRDLAIPPYAIQSANPVGRGNIDGLLKNYTKFRSGGRE